MYVAILTVFSDSYGSDTWSPLTKVILELKDHCISILRKFLTIQEICFLKIKITPELDKMHHLNF